MRQVGINQYIGDPALYQGLKLLQDSFRKSNLQDRIVFDKLSPANRFNKLIQKRFQKLHLSRYKHRHSYYKANAATVINLAENDFLDDIKNGEKFIMHCDFLYVVDSMREERWGSKAIKDVINICEESSCILTLFSLPFALGSNGLPEAFTSYEGLLDELNLNKKKLVDCSSDTRDALVHFYKSNGFKNFCLYNDDVNNCDPENVLAADQQLAYVPKSLAAEHRESISYRLNTKLCRWNKENFA